MEGGKRSYQRAIGICQKQPSAEWNEHLTKLDNNLIQHFDFMLCPPKGTTISRVDHLKFYQISFYPSCSFAFIPCLLSVKAIWFFYLRSILLSIIPSILLSLSFIFFLLSFFPNSWNFLLSYYPSFFYSLPSILLSWNFFLSFHHDTSAGRFFRPGFCIF